MKKWVYMFSEGDATQRNLLGGKGANLAEMTKIGLPVPQGFTVSTEACNEYLKNSKLTDEMVDQIKEHLTKLQTIAEKKFGDEKDPLLVSVRSGARISMPGMMDTILNLGLNDQTVLGLAANTGNDRFAYDSYRRFIQMFGDVVQEINSQKFEAVLDEIKSRNNYKYDTELTTQDLKEVVKRYKDIILSETGNPFPQQPAEQLFMSVEAVFRSWDNPRAIVYRDLNDIPQDIGTAVNVQCMVFGNMGDDSGTGVAFTRDPATGEKDLFGEFLVNAQGEDVVAGIRTPQPIAQLKDIMPKVYDQFAKTAELLEQHYHDMQDMEFTIEKGKLFMLQTRNGKRTAAAAVRCAVEMVEEGLINKETAVTRVEPQTLDQLLHPTFNEESLKAATPITSGLPASPGAATGRVYFTADAAKNASENGEDVILVRQETSPEDIEGMYASKGIMTARGGMTSHAAVVARGMGTCCVAGCDEIKVEETSRIFHINGQTIKEGDYISLDGSTGNVYLGSIKTQSPELSGNFATLMKWADEFRTMDVRTNADTPRDAAKAVEFGAEGIGLCRTEHMFFDEDRIPSVRRMILSKTVEQREKYLAELLPMQKSDFIGIYKAMKELPVTVRLLDPPLHEFLPTDEEDILALAKDMNMSIEEMKADIDNLEEFNPMLGHRGCRLDVTYPEIGVMQTRAIMEAAIEVSEKYDYHIVPEIMIPLVGMVGEIEYVAGIVHNTAEKVKEEKHSNIEYKIGTMIEIPRATVVADQIAKTAEFFSFGTNDLTQMTFGFSRDDASKFIPTYKDKNILPGDPFASIDQEGVGQLVKNGVKLGRQTRPDMKCGVCGEHGGDPKSVKFFNSVGLSYVSCSPFRVPIARLAAAQAAIEQK
ncbi:MAG: pyruvate, phosphate dikinase [Eubacteriaceae bacterium]|nr:pyruvate, phosphate dikinase [Eubacteriaceae bacterium]MDD4507711.1 pyruvate, phosphate dikinase [Eubacteriaceae bacterium]